jgi:uncharacterized membrane protein YdbT with pleckstrin-like domain
MSYIRSSLGANETVHYIAHFHWIRYAVAYGALIISIVLGIFLRLSSESFLVGIVPPVIGVIIFLSIMLPIWTTEIGVTNQRIIYKTGLISRDTNELQLRSIEEVSMQQGVLGRILGYGRIEIHGTGEEEIVLPNLGDPLELRTALQEAIGDVQRTTEPVSSGAAPQRAPVE